MAVVVERKGTNCLEVEGGNRWDGDDFEFDFEYKFELNLILEWSGWVGGAGLGL